MAKKKSSRNLARFKEAVQRDETLTNIELFKSRNKEESDNKAMAKAAKEAITPLVWEI